MSYVTITRHKAEGVAIKRFDRRTMKGRTMKGRLNKDNKDASARLAGDYDHLVDSSADTRTGVYIWVVNEDHKTLSVLRLLLGSHERKYYDEERP